MTMQVLQTRAGCKQKPHSEMGGVIGILITENQLQQLTYHLKHIFYYNKIMEEMYCHSVTDELP